MKKIKILFCLLVASSYSASAQDFSWAGDYVDGNSWVTAMTVDNSGSVYTAVIYTETVDFDPGPVIFPETGGEEGQTSIQKLDANGNLIWVKSFHEIVGDGIVGNGFEISAMTMDNSGNLFLTGGFSGTIDFDPGDEELAMTSVGWSVDIFVMKLDDEGDLVWTNTIGGNNIDSGVDIELDPDGDVCVTGTFFQTVDFDAGDGIEELTAAGVEVADVFVLKLTNAGEFIWVKSIESESSDQVFDLEVDENNNIYIGGHFNSTADFDVGLGEYLVTATGAHEGFLLKLDETGAYNWVVTISESLLSEITSLKIDNYDNVYAAGDFVGEAVDFDPGAGIAHLSSIGQEDVFVAKYTNAGELIWARKLGGAGNDKNAIIEISEINSLYVLGTYRENIDVDPSDIDYILEHTAGDGENQDLFLTTLNKDGEFLQAISFTGDRNDFCADLKSGAEGSIYMAGTTLSTLDIDPSGDEFLIYGDYSELAAYVLKLQDGNVGLAINERFAQISLFPNPMEEEFTIQLNEVYSEIDVEISDYLGRVIQRTTFYNAANLDLNLAAPEGMYFVKLIFEGEQVVLKVLKRT